MAMRVYVVVDTSADVWRVEAYSDKDAADQAAWSTDTMAWEVEVWDSPPVLVTVTKAAVDVLGRVSYTQSRLRRPDYPLIGQTHIDTGREVRGVTATVAGGVDRAVEVARAALEVALQAQKEQREREAKGK
jgi:hypothetical protein